MEAPRHIAAALARIHPEARFVFDREENRWLVCREIRHNASPRARYERCFALPAQPDGRRGEPCVAVLPGARLYFKFRSSERAAEAMLKAHFQRLADSYNAWVKRDAAETDYTANDTYAYLKRQFKKLGYDTDTPTMNLDRRGLDELRQRDPDTWQAWLELNGYEEPQRVEAELENRDDWQTVA